MGTGSCYYNCTTVSNCSAYMKSLDGSVNNTNHTLVNYCFSSCYAMSHCYYTASYPIELVTAIGHTYTSCYADRSRSKEVADTADGGYNEA